MELHSKLGLFFTGYLPLFFILVLKNWNNYYMIGLLLIVSGYSVAWLYRLSRMKKPVNNSCLVEHIDHDDVPNSVYIIWYVIPFIGVPSDIWTGAILVVLLIVLFKIYTGSDLIRINPLLNVVGYKLYSVKVLNEPINIASSPYEVLLITNSKRITVSDHVEAKKIDNEVYLDNE